MWGIVGTDGRYIDFFLGISNDCWNYIAQKGYNVDHIQMSVTVPAMRVVQPYQSEIINMMKEYWIGKAEWEQF